MLLVELPSFVVVSVLGAVLLMRLVMCGFRFIVLSRVVPSKNC